LGFLRQAIAEFAQMTGAARIGKLQVATTAADV
jgi:hypothetical protein